MRICVVVPNAEYLGQAGARLRYGRTMVPLSEAGHSLTLMPVDQFEEIEHDVYLFSKCFDASALAIAHMAAAKGRAVGVDLFDDYFSEADDSRFQRLRAWLVACLDIADFVLCSTLTMRRVAGQYAPNLPVHVMNDPSDGHKMDKLKTILTRKYTTLWADRVLNVVWYGMGDNSYFPVGLADLADFSDELAGLQRKGFEVRLTVLTNRRAMTGNALAALSTIPVSYDIREWSEAEETTLLARSHVVFLPVSAQNFSIAKSLNRVVTALCAGNQVLSAGFPLYDVFSDFIYRDASKLVEDLEFGRPRLRAETLSSLDDLLRRHADPAVESRSLASFLETIVSAKSPTIPDLMNTRPPYMVVHGVESTEQAHDFAKRLGGLSVSSPLTSLRSKFDVRFEWNVERTGLDLLMSPEAFALLNPEIAHRVFPSTLIDGSEFRHVSQDDVALLVCKGGHLATGGSEAGKLAAHAYILSTIRHVLSVLFPDIPCILSENWRLPWSLSAVGAQRRSGVM